MNTPTYTAILQRMKEGLENAEHFGDTTYVVRTSQSTWSVCDNGEEIPDCNIENAVRIIAENLGDTPA